MLAGQTILPQSVEMSEGAVVVILPHSAEASEGADVVILAALSSR